MERVERIERVERKNRKNDKSGLESKKRKESIASNEDIEHNNESRTGTKQDGQKEKNKVSEVVVKDLS